jgi:hypothetical protein
MACDLGTLQTKLESALLKNPALQEDLGRVMTFFGGMWRNCPVSAVVNIDPFVIAAVSGLGIAVNQNQFVAVPGTDFIHASIPLNGNYASVIYFANPGIGLVTIQLPQNGVVYYTLKRP